MFRLIVKQFRQLHVPCFARHSCNLIPAKNEPIGVPGLLRGCIATFLTVSVPTAVLLMSMASAKTFAMVFSGL